MSSLKSIIYAIWLFIVLVFTVILAIIAVIFGFVANAFEYAEQRKAERKLAERLEQLAEI